MKSVLMVAQMPLIASSLAKILSDGRSSTRQAKNHACIHEWNGKFLGEKVSFKMTSVCGNFVKLDFTHKSFSPAKVAAIELFSCPIHKKEMKNFKIIDMLAEEAKGCKVLILWLDCDKEGENICFEVMNAVSKSNQNFSHTVTYRVYFSTLTEKNIKAVFTKTKLSYPNKSEAKSIDARRELNLRIGCAFTTCQAQFFKGRYENLDTSLLSFDICETPTLGFCVKRHNDIQSFQPEPFWYIQLQAGDPSLSIEWTRGRVAEKKVAIIILNEINKFKEAKVESVVSTEKFITRPKALNTAELLRSASSELGLGPKTCLQIAEKLYSQGYISFPKTETTNYPTKLYLYGILKLLENSIKFGNEAQQILGDLNPPTNFKDCGKHPPITPTKLGNQSDFDINTWRVYEYICRHFLATVSHDLKYKSTTVNLTVGKEVFSCTTSTLLDPGFTKILKTRAFGKCGYVSLFKKGEMVPISNIMLVESQTMKPDYLTESELITLMEKHGIGTNASISEHINNICQRNYVTVATGRKLVPTTLGIVFIRLYETIDQELVLPTLCSEMEQLISLLARGLANFNSIVRHIIEIFRWKYLHFMRNIPIMDNTFENTFSTVKAGKALSRCGKCHRYMSYIEEKSYINCFHCKATYPLPSNGIIRVYGEFTCPLDGFGLLTILSSDRKGPSTLCPYCYNNPQFKDMPKNSGCSSCTHPTCQHSLNSLRIFKCVECPNGVLVLDCYSAPRWKINCNRCHLTIKCFKNASKITVDDKHCDCGAKFITVHYKHSERKFSDGSFRKTACIFCSEYFIHLVENHNAFKSIPAELSKRYSANIKSGVRHDRKLQW